VPVRRPAEDHRHEKSRTEGRSSAISVKRFFQTVFNLRTPEGKAYDQQLGKEFPQKYLDTMKQCKQSASNDLADFWMLIKLDKSGAVKEVLLSPATKMAACARETLLKGSFSPPPHPAYWVSIYMKLSH